MSGFGPRSCPDCGHGTVVHDDLGCHRWFTVRVDDGGESYTTCDCEVPDYEMAQYRKSLRLPAKEAMPND